MWSVNHEECDLMYHDEDFLNDLSGQDLQLFLFQDREREPPCSVECADANDLCKYANSLGEGPSALDLSSASSKHPIIRMSRKSSEGTNHYMWCPLGNVTQETVDTLSAFISNEVRHALIMSTGQDHKTSSLCSCLAQQALKSGHPFLCELPNQGSLERAGWADVMSKVDCDAIQYRDNSQEGRSTVFISNHPKMLLPLNLNMLKPDKHHAKMPRWSYHFASLVACGISAVHRDDLQNSYPVEASSSSTCQADTPVPKRRGRPPKVPIDGPAWKKCPGCRQGRPMTDESHSREADVCKYPDIVPIIWSCPGCKDLTSRYQRFDSK